MKLSECTMGTLVIERRIPGNTSTSPLRIGHVTGLEVNSTGETIPVVQFARPYMKGSSLTSIHHANLDRYLD